MSKSTIDDIASRKPTMVLHARNYVDPGQEKPLFKGGREVPGYEEPLPLLSHQALLDLLVSKGIITREEHLERMDEIKKGR